MLRRLGLLLLSFIAVIALRAQPLSAYVDMQNKVMVWDNGMIRKIDYLPPVDLKIGRAAIPYLDNSRTFKIYYGGGMRVINNGFTNEFHVSDNLVAFKNASVLNVFDNGEITKLSGLCDQYFMGDSVILFFDGVRSTYKAYYDGNVYPIENFLAGNALNLGDKANNGVKVSDNIAAYVNYASQFHIFYHGEIIAQESNLINGFEVGRNTVAYVDINREFKIFHEGQTFIVDDFPPKSFQAGDNVVAYVSGDGYFKIFYGDSVRTVGYFTPDYIVGDNVVAFRDGSGYFKVFYKGRITSLESYFPENLSVQYNSLAYVNQTGMLRMFSEGEVYDVTNATLDSWTLSYDVIKYQVGRNLFRIFYRGNEY